MSQPSPEFHPARPTEESEESSPFGLLVFGLGALAFAAVVMWSGAWESQIDGYDGQRRRAWAELLQHIGQVPVAAIAAVVGLASLAAAVHGFVTARTDEVA